jgi:predicted  nucleic acid-binding Zn-ribbon protein
MTRVCAPVDDTVLAQIDKEVEEKGISRAQWVNMAISTYLTQDDTKLEQLKRDLTQAVSDREQTWRESTQLRQEKEHLSAELEHSRHEVVSLEASVADIERHKEEHRRHIEELERLKVTHEKTLEAMKLKDDEISFLRGHVSQLTQSISQLALKPGDEEIKRKGWSWRFWK